MKYLLAASLAALIPAAAQAQETRTEERVVVMAGPGGPMEIGDEGLTREAFMARHSQMFDHMDADHDGTISRDEMQAMHGMMMLHTGDGEHGAGHGPGMAMFSGDDGEQVVLNDDGEWTSPDGSRRIIVRRRGPDGQEMPMADEAIDIEGPFGDGGQLIVIRGAGPEGGPPMMIDGDHAGHGGGEREILIFRHQGEAGLDADGDGRWSLEEMTSPIRERFNQIDANHDGFIDADERDQ